MSIQDQIDAAGRKTSAPAMEKIASASDEDDLKLADLMDKYASIHAGGVDQDAITQQILGDIVTEADSGEKAALRGKIRSELTDLGVLQ